MLADGMKMWNGNGITTTLLFSLNRLMEYMMVLPEVKNTGVNRTQLLDDLRNRRRYWELKEEAEDRKRWRRQFINRT